MDTQTQTDMNTDGLALTWAQRVDPVMGQVSTFLRSKQQSLTIEADITGEVWDTCEDAKTYTRADVQNGAMNAIDHTVGRKDTSHKDKSGKLVPLNTDGLGDLALAKHLDATSTHSGKTKRICIKAMSSVRWAAKSAYKQARLATAVGDGKQWFADGVMVKDTDTPRPFVSRRKAVSAYLRATVGDNWSTMPNKGELKDGALAHVRQGAIEAPTAQENRDAQAQVRAQPSGKATPAPVATQTKGTAQVTKAQLVEQAVALGLTKASANKMRKAKLQATVSALQSL